MRMRPSRKDNTAKRFISVRYKFLLSLIALSTFIAIVLSIISYRMAESKVREISLQLAESNTSTAVSELDAYLDEIHDWSGRFAAISELRTLAALQSYTDDALSEDASTQASASKLVPARVKFIISDAAANNVDFDFVSICLANGYSYLSQSAYSLPFDDYDSCLSYLGMSEAAANETYSGSIWRLCSVNTGNEDTTTLVYVRFIYQSVTLDKLGVMVFGINEERLAESYSRFAEQAYLIDTDGIILSASGNQGKIATHSQSSSAIASLHSQKVFSSFYRDDSRKERMVTYQQLSRLNAFLIVPFDIYEGINAKEMRSFMISAVWIVLAAIVVAALLAYPMSRGLSKQISDLTKFTKKVEDGQTQLRCSMRGADEVSYLANQINRMLDQLQQAAAQREAGLRENQQLELQLNQIQINPHLLYNTLDSVLWVLHQNRVEDASELLAALSGFFKISLSRGHDKIPFANEIQLVQHYLDIQRLARQQNIQLKLDIDDKLYEYPILKLSVQPLVENAVVHGFAGYRDDGCIDIRARETDDCMQIEVTDNGIGLLPEEVEAVNQTMLLSGLPDGARHFAMFNINRRIIQTYGADYGISIESEVSVGTTITMRLPHMRP